MSIPELKKIKSEKKYHNTTLKDDYSWVDQPDILDVLKNPNKLHPEVKKYIEENNLLTEKYFDDVKDLQKKLFNEIKSKIKLDDTSLKEFNCDTNSSKANNIASHFVQNLYTAYLLSKSYFHSTPYSHPLGRASVLSVNSY